MADNTKNNRQSINSLSKRKLISLVRDDMGYTSDDFDFKNISRDELLEIVGNTMGSELDFNKGGAVIKKSIGPSDYRKGGMVLSSVDRRKK
jgi:hypothetical protein